MALSLKQVHDWHNDGKVETTLQAGTHNETLYYGPDKTLDALRDPSAWHTAWVQAMDQMKARHEGVEIVGFDALQDFHRQAAKLLSPTI